MKNYFCFFIFGFSLVTFIWAQSPSDIALENFFSGVSIYLDTRTSDDIKFIFNQITPSHIGLLEQLKEKLLSTKKKIIIGDSVPDLSQVFDFLGITGNVANPPTAIDMFTETVLSFNHSGLLKAVHSLDMFFHPVHYHTFNKLENITKQKIVFLSPLMTESNFYQQLKSHDVLGIIPLIESQDEIDEWEKLLNFLEVYKIKMTIENTYDENILTQSKLLTFLMSSKLSNEKKKLLRRLTNFLPS